MERDYAKEVVPFALPDRPLIVSFSLEPVTTALVIIDMQYGSACRTTGLGKAMKEKGQEAAWEYRYSRIEKILIPNIRKLLDFFRKTNLRIIYIQGGSKMPDYSDCLPHRRAFYMSENNTQGNREHEILDEIKPLPGEYAINKLTSSAFTSSNIDMILRAMGIKYLLFTGVSTNLCVETAARDAADRGYCCLFVEDGCGSTDEIFHNNTLMHARSKLGRVETTDDVIKELSTTLSQKRGR